MLELDGIRKVTPLLLPCIRGQGPDVRAHVSESDSVRGVTGSAAVGGRGGLQEEGGSGEDEGGGGGIPGSDK